MTINEIENIKDEDNSQGNSSNNTNRNVEQQNSHPNGNGDSNKSPFVQNPTTTLESSNPTNAATTLNNIPNNKNSNESELRSNTTEDDQRLSDTKTIGTTPLSSSKGHHTPPKHGRETNNSIKETQTSLGSSVSPTTRNIKEDWWGQSRRLRKTFSSEDLQGIPSVVSSSPNTRTRTAVITTTADSASSYYREKLKSLLDRLSHPSSTTGVDPNTNANNDNGRHHPRSQHEEGREKKMMTTGFGQGGEGDIVMVEQERNVEDEEDFRKRTVSAPMNIPSTKLNIKTPPGNLHLVNPSSHGSVNPSSHGSSGPGSAGSAGDGTGASSSSLTTTRHQHYNISHIQNNNQVIHNNGVHIQNHHSRLHSGSFASHSSSFASPYSSYSFSYSPSPSTLNNPLLLTPPFAPTFLLNHHSSGSQPSTTNAMTSSSSSAMTSASPPAFVLGGGFSRTPPTNTVLTHHMNNNVTPTPPFKRTTNFGLGAMQLRHATPSSFGEDENLMKRKKTMTLEEKRNRAIRIVQSTSSSLVSTNHNHHHQNTSNDNNGVPVAPVHTNDNGCGLMDRIGTSPNPSPLLAALGAGEFSLGLGSTMQSHTMQSHSHGTMQSHSHGAMQSHSHGTLQSHSHGSPSLIDTTAMNRNALSRTGTASATSKANIAMRNPGTSLFASSTVPPFRPEKPNTSIASSAVSSMVANSRDGLNIGLGLGWSRIATGTFSQSLGKASLLEKREGRLDRLGEEDGEDEDEEEYLFANMVKDEIGDVETAFLQTLQTIKS
eukprot:g3516.t1